MEIMIQTINQCAFRMIGCILLLLVYGYMLLCLVKLALLILKSTYKALKKDTTTNKDK